MERVTAREFARKQGQAINGLKALAGLPMTEAEGHQILTSRVRPYFDFTFLPLLLMRSGQARLAAGLAERFSLRSA